MTATPSRDTHTNSIEERGYGWAANMLNTRNEETNAVFYSYVACFVNTFTLHMYVSMSYTG